MTNVDEANLETAEVVETPTEDVEPTPEEQAEKDAQKKERQAEGTRNSWKNPEVAEKRKKRRACVVTNPNGEQLRFDSVWQAWQHYGLSGGAGKCILFRRELRAEEGKELILEDDKATIPGKYTFIDTPFLRVFEKDADKKPKVKKQPGEEGFLPKKSRKKKDVAPVAENEVPEDAEPVDVEASFE